MGGQAQIGLHLVELQRQYDTERVALAVKVSGLQRIIHLAERDIPGLCPKRLEEVARNCAARAADLQSGEIGGGVDRPRAGRQMMKPVLQAMAEGMDPVLRQLAADLIAERAVERCEHRLRIEKCEGQQRQCAGRRDLPERRTCHEEFEHAGAHIGEHLGVGSEPALRKHLDEEFPTRIPKDRLRHLGDPFDGRAGARLVEAKAIVKSRILIGRHRAIIVRRACASQRFGT